jgi:hypothetical protein
MPGCKDAARLYSRSREETLPLADRIGLFVHLKMCSLCSRYTRQIAWMEEKMAAMDNGFHSQGLYAEAAQKIKQRLSRASEEKKQNNKKNL